MGRTAPLVYVVEDDRPLRVLLEDLLLDAGYQVLTCRNADEAYYCISAERPDLVIFDNHFAHYAAGWRFLDQLRACPETATLPLILLSVGAPYANGKADALRAHGCYLVEKPFDLSHLLTTVSAALGVVPTEQKVTSV